MRHKFRIAVIFFFLFSFVFFSARVQAITNYFLPLFYVPQNIIYSNGGVKNLPNILSFEDYKIRSGIYLGGEIPNSKSQITNKFQTSNSKEENKTTSEILERADEVFVEGKLENAIDKDYFEEKEIFRNSVPFPYVKHKPGSFWWRWARLREKFEEWKVKKDVEKLIEKKLFYAGKRISELEKFADSTDEALIKQMADGYQTKMEEVINKIKKLENSTTPENGKLRDLSVIKLRAYWERHKEEIGKLEKWWSVFEELDEKIRALEKKFDLRSLEYSFEIPKGGEYELFFRNNTENTDDADKDANNADRKVGRTLMTVVVDGREINLEEAKIREDGWISLGKERFEEEKHKLVLNLPELENLVGDNWHKLKEVEIKDKEVGFSRQEFFPNAKEFIFQKINNWQRNNLYYLTFDYKTEEGNLGVGVLEKKTEYQKKEKVVKIQKILEGSLKSKNKEWEKFEVVIKPDPDTLEARIYFYVFAEPDQFAEVNFRNVRIYRIVQPKIILRSKIEKYTASPRNKIEIPKITFVKVNPTKYRIKVRGAKEPYTLVFSESFHEGWRAYISNQQPATSDQHYGEIVASYFEGEIKEGTHKNIFLDRNTFETWNKKSIPEERHLLVNGYANFWYITPADTGGREDYEIIIEFWPQRLFYIGLGISGLTLIGCLGYLGYNFAKRRIGVGNEEN